MELKLPGMRIADEVARASSGSAAFGQSDRGGPDAPIIGAASTDTVTLSTAAQSATRVMGSSETADTSDATTARREREPDTDLAPRARDGRPLNPGEVRRLKQLRVRDREVKARSADPDIGHQGSVRLVYETGPDGERYAIHAVADLDVERGASPEETMRLVSYVRRAAASSPNPSAFDFVTRAKAEGLAREAEQALAARQSASFEVEDAPEAPAPPMIGASARTVSESRGLAHYGAKGSGES